ncbi:MAG TPA: NUDIX domain-containing protein [Conexivisphaerales archaeon]|nr:NUDIX domain-containing protein [Conexivisphaerales archaeon]
MRTRVYAGALLIEKGNLLLKAGGPEPESWYLPPGKYLEDDETLEMAVSKGFRADTGCLCAVRDLVYVIESFRGEDERELGLYFLVSSPSLMGPGGTKGRVRFVPIEQMKGMDIRPAVLGGKISADERRGSRGSATYLVNRWNE